MSDVHVHVHPCDGCKVGHKLDQILTLIGGIMSTQAELAAALDAVNTKLIKIGTEVTTILTRIDELEAAVAANPVSPEVQAAMDRVTSQAQVLDDLNPDTPVPPV